MSAPAFSFEDYDWCESCGCNPVYGPGLCSSCRADEDFMNCQFCHGSSCSQDCEDDDWMDGTASQAAVPLPTSAPVRPGEGEQT